MYEELVEAVSELEYEKSISIVEAYLEKGRSAGEILSNLSKGLLVVGTRFEKKEYFLSELIFAAEIMKECSKILEPQLLEESKEILKVGKAIVGTVEGDLHDIGKNIFITLMKASGFDVKDLGVNVPAERFIEAIKTYHPQILGMSALLTTTASGFKNVIDMMCESGIRDSIFVMIGGPPHVSAEEVGADVYSNDAFEGTTIALEYMKQKEAND